MDKRELKRRHLIYYLRVFDQKTNQIVGHLVNINLDGIMLISEEPIETDALFHLKMTFPSQIFGKENLEFIAKSVWSKHDVNPDFYDTGFKLQDIKWDDVSTIKELI
ncbi:MAG: PilZ domain-containing protein, partial [Chloroflexota bacterium]|nr:PilZ domain-containing protein [Chloroflexota bacterium]